MRKHRIRRSRWVLVGAEYLEEHGISLRRTAGTAVIWDWDDRHADFHAIDQRLFRRLERHRRCRLSYISIALSYTVTCEDIEKNLYPIHPSQAYENQLSPGPSLPYDPLWDAPILLRFI